MPPVGFEPTISAGERPLGPARLYLPTKFYGVLNPISSCVPAKHAEFEDFQFVGNGTL